MIFTILLPILALATTEAPESVVRQYDLRAYGFEVDLEERQVAMLPGAYAFLDDEPERERIWAMDPDFVTELIESAFAEEFEYEGRMIWTTERGRLVVKAPLPVHERVARVLDDIGTAVHASAELEIFVITLPPGSEWEMPTGLVDVAETQGLRENLGGGASRELYAVRLQAGRTARIDLTRQHHLLADYDVEVAQGAFSFDPKVVAAQSGMLLELRGAPAPGGLELALLMKQGTPTSEVEEVDLQQQGFAGSETGHGFYDAPQMLQRLAIAERAFACNTALPDGKALVLRNTLELSSASGTQYVVVRRSRASQRSGSLRTIHALRGIGADSWLINGEGMARPYWRFDGYLDQYLLSRLTLDRMHWEDSSQLLTSLGREDIDMATEILHSSRPDLEMDGGRLWLFVRQNADVAEELRDSGVGIPDLEPLVDELFPASEVVTVSVAVRRLGEGASRGARCDLPVGVGRTSAAVLGVESTTTADYDVEIAQNASVADPVTWLTFDGLVFTVTPRRDGSGKLTLHLRGVAHLLDEEISFDPDSPMHGDLNLHRFDRLTFDEVLEVGTGRTASFQLGARIAGPESQAMTLDIQVR